MTQQSDPGYRYWSFISYSHHDKRVARRLATELRKEPVPVQHRADVAGDQPTFSVFLDEQESGAGADLSAELRAALDASHKLIVICSPFAVASTYVAAEIRHFQSRGRSRDIICVVASGEPNATDEGRPQFECFPEPLRASTDAGATTTSIPVPERPLAVRLGHETDAEWAGAVEHVSAGLLGVSRTELRTLRDRRKRRTVVRVAAISLLVLGSIAAGLWAFYWPNASYAHDFVRRFGVWEEVDVRSRSEARTRHHTFKFVRRGALGPLTSVHVISGSGQCPSETQLMSITGDTFTGLCSTVRACSVDFDYTNEGSVGTETFRDQFGNAIETLSYSGSSAGILSEAVLGCSRTRTGIEIIHFERFENGPWKGLDRRILFRGGDDKGARANKSYEFGASFEYDESGRVSERFALDENGRRVINTLGYAGLRRSADAQGRLTRLEFLDTDGKPIVNTDGVAEYTYTFAQSGVSIRKAYGLLQAPVLDRVGVHATETAYGPRGEVLSIKYRDVAGNPTLSSQRYAEVRHDVNEGGFVTAESFFDAQSRPTPGEIHRCYRREYKRDDFGNIISSRCMDANGKPAYSYFGVHEIRDVFDARGNTLETTHWDIYGKPAFCLAADRDPEGEGRLEACPVHRAVSTYDPKTNNRIRVRFLDPKGSLIASGDGIAGWNAAFDNNGFELQRRYVSTDEKPRYSEGAFGKRVEPDRLRRSRLGMSLDADGNPTPNAKGILTTQMAYDALGREVSRQYRDAAGEIIKYSGMDLPSVAEYDLFGNTVAQHWLTLPNRKAGSSAIATTRMKYDVYQREVERTSYDSQGRVIANDEGHVVLLMDRDARGNVVRVRHVDADRRSIVMLDGTSGFDKVYDALDRPVQVINIGSTGSPQENRDGVCIFEQGFDDRGLMTRSSTHDCAGNPVPDAEHGVFAIRYRHDERGHVLREDYLDRSGAPMLSKMGVAGLERGYDVNNQLEVETNFGIDGKPAANSDGVAIGRFLYDSHGFARERVLYTAEGKMERLIEFQRDVQGRERIRRMLTPARHLMLAPLSGRAEIRSEYDTQGRLIEERSYGLTGNPVNRKDFGWHRKSWVYLDGQLQEERCYTATGARMSECRS